MPNDGEISPHTILAQPSDAGCRSVPLCTFLLPTGGGEAFEGADRRALRHISTPPHDLAKLAHEAKITLDDSRDLFLRTLTKYYIGTRYPEEVRTLADEATKELSTRLLIQTKELLQWVETLPK